MILKSNKFAEGPWNHAAKLEKFPGTLSHIDLSCQSLVISAIFQEILAQRPLSFTAKNTTLWDLSRYAAADVEFSAIVDPNTELAHQRIADLQKGKFADKWSNTKVFSHYRDLLDSPVRTYTLPMLLSRNADMTLHMPAIVMHM